MDKMAIAMYPGTVDMSKTGIGCVVEDSLCDFLAQNTYCTYMLLAPTIAEREIALVACSEFRGTKTTL